MSEPYWVPLGAAPVVEHGQELAYAEYATTGVGNTTEASPNIIVTAPAVVCDGSPILIEFFSPAANPHNASAAILNIALYQDDVSIGRLAIISNPAPSGAVYLQVPVQVARKLTPTPGSHVYKVGAWVSTGTGGVYGGTGGSGQNMPGYIRITKV